MKNILTALAVSLAVTTTAFGAEYANITNISQVNGNTKVTVQRTYTGQDNKENPLSEFVYLFKGVLTPQTAVNKVSLLADGNITVKTHLASTTAKVGQVSILAQKRSEAYFKGGLAGYLTELARQIEDEGVLW